jgi:hypothetical protein
MQLKLIRKNLGRTFGSSSKFVKEDVDLPKRSIRASPFYQFRISSSTGCDQSNGPNALAAVTLHDAIHSLVERDAICSRTRKPVSSRASIGFG